MLIEYTKIHSLGAVHNEGILDELVVCESKVDGANFKFRYMNDEIIYGSHHNILIDPNEKEWPAVRAIKQAFKDHKDKFIPNVIYFCESMKPHTLKYDNVPDAIGFDVFDIAHNEYYDWRRAKDAFEAIGIPFVHIHFEKQGLTINDIKDLYKQSPYRKDGDEGITIKCYTRKNKFGEPLFAKLVTDRFKEENKKVFKCGNNEELITEEQKIVFRYLTNARFKKAIFRLKEDHDNIDMTLMPAIISYVSSDILNENILDISRNFKSIDFKQYRSLVAKKCATMLKEYLLGNI